MSLGRYWLSNLRICSGKPRDLMNGLRSRDSEESVAVSCWKYLKILVFCRFLKSLKKLAGRQGVSAGASRNLKKHGLFAQAKRGQRFAVFDWLRPFSSVRHVFQILRPRCHSKCHSPRTSPEFLSSETSVKGFSTFPNCGARSWRSDAAAANHG